MPDPKTVAAIAEKLSAQQREALLMTHSWDGVVGMSPTLESLCALGLLAVVVKTHTASGWGAGWTPLGLLVARHLLAMSADEAPSHD